MSYQFFNTCFGVPDVSVSNCAGWVQAWGSLIGLAIAIALPLWLHSRERKAKLLDEAGSALVVATGLVLVVDQMLGASRTIVAQMRDHKPGTSALSVGFVHTALCTLNLPTTEEILRIQHVDRDLSVALAKGTTGLRQLADSVAAVRGHVEISDLPSVVVMFRPNVEGAIKELEIASARLKVLIASLQAA